MELIDGVELLSKSKDCGSIGGGIMVLIITIIFLILSIYGFVQREYVFATLFTFMTVCFLYLFLYLLFQPKEIYKVTIDKSVTMEEFYQRYDIINQEGKIYTVTVKEKK